jgi:hypothetical protein
MKLLQGLGVRVGLGLLKYIPSMGTTRILKFKFRILVMYPFRSSETVV